MRYTAENALVRPQTDGNDPGLIIEVTPQSAGWEYISFPGAAAGHGRQLVL